MRDRLETDAVHTGGHIQVTFESNVNDLAKKSDFFKKSELSIKTCSVNVALDSMYVINSHGKSAPNSIT